MQENTVFAFITQPGLLQNISAKAQDTIPAVLPPAEPSE